MVLYPILLSQSWSTTVPNFILVSGIAQSGQNLALSRLANMSALKWGQRSSSAIIGAFLQTVFFSLMQQQDVFLNSKKGRSLSEGLN